MGIPDNELQQITNQYLDEADDNIEQELAPFITEGWTINDKEMATRVDYVIHKMEEKIEEDEQIANGQKEVLQAKIDKLQEGIDKLNEWLDRSTKPYKSRIDDLKTHLHLFHQRTIEQEEETNKKRIEEGKKPLKISKSIKLPYRDLVSREQSPEITKDDAALITWIEDSYTERVPVEKVVEAIELHKEQGHIKFTYLMDLLKPYDAEYLKRDTKLAWAELKKTLEEVDMKGKLIMVNEDGEEIPHIKLTGKPRTFDWKLNK